MPHHACMGSHHQGVSLDRAVTDLGLDVPRHGQPGTALTQVRSMAGVMLVGLPETSVSKNNPYVHEEYARLPLDYQLSSIEGL